jgi:adenylyltransferase/sulfurtransferase
LPRWQASTCAIIGLGGLGGGLALQLARFGVHRLVLVDRDIVREENLGHQQLFTADHARLGLPKIQAAAEILSAVNPSVLLHVDACELSRRNIGYLLADADMIFDGLDNYFSRLLLNDYAWSCGKPYFYAGVVRGELSAGAFIPGKGGCLRCLVDTPPPPGSMPSCSSEGVFPPLLALANLLQIELAGRHLAGEMLPDLLYSFNMRDLQLRQFALPPRADCPVCSRPVGAGRYDYLGGALDELAASTCSPGRIELELPAGLDLALAEARLRESGDGFLLRRNAYCLSAERAGLSYTLFSSGKVVLEGGDNAAQLNHFAATYLGL